jgi:hypothetical protein
MFLRHRPRREYENHCQGRHETQWLCSFFQHVLRLEQITVPEFKLSACGMDNKGRHLRSVMVCSFGSFLLNVRSINVEVRNSSISTDPCYCNFWI